MNALATMADEIPFLKYGVPALFLIGAAVFLFFGYKGVVAKSTIALGKRRAGSGGPAQITGVPAQIVGVLYIVLGACFTCVSGWMAYRFMA